MDRTMTGAELTTARERLGLTAAALGRALELEGRDPGQTVRRYETEARAIPGPVRVAVRLMLAAQIGRPPTVKRGRELTPYEHLEASGAFDGPPILLEDERQP
jgi:hypothetical protein